MSTKVVDSRRGIIRALSGLLAIGAAPVARAQAFPSRPLRLIVPFPPGGPTDAMGRLIGQSLSDRVGRAVVVDNRAGAGSMIGIEAVAKSAPDGYTLGLATADSFSLLPVVRKTLPFDPDGSFTPLALMARLPNVFAVHPSVPAKSIKELVALAKAEPGVIRYASPGLGTLPHFAVELLCMRAKAELTHVPYKGGGPAVADTLAGHVQMVSTGVVAVAQHVKAGQLRALAVTSEQRSPLLPDVPTMIESGFSDFVALPWFGVTAPAGLPADIADRLTQELVACAEEPEFQKRLLEFGGITGQKPLVREEFRRFQAAEIDKWKQVVVASNFKLMD